jgi:hypothetical protein
MVHSFYRERLFLFHLGEECNTDSSFFIAPKEGKQWETNEEQSIGARNPLKGTEAYWSTSRNVPDFSG